MADHLTFENSGSALVFEHRHHWKRPIRPRDGHHRWFEAKRNYLSNWCDPPRPFDDRQSTLVGARPLRV